MEAKLISTNDEQMIEGATGSQNGHFDSRLRPSPWRDPTPLFARPSLPGGSRRKLDGTIDSDRADAGGLATPMCRSGTRANAAQGRRRARHRRARSDGTAPCPTGGASLLQARTVNEVVKAQTNKVRLARLKGELVDRPQAIAHVFKLARSERDAWLNWPARISAQMAAKLNIDPHTMHIALEAAVREHLQELGETAPRVD